MCWALLPEDLRRSGERDREIRRGNFPSDAVDTFWTYVEERERIRVRREAGQPWPWTTDPILQKYKFTNVRRVHDRTTQEFLAVYRAHRGAAPPVALYNAAVRRMFGTAEFSEAVGWLPQHDAEALRRAEAACPKPWTGAYMIRANNQNREPKVVTVIGYLSGLWGRAKEIASAVEQHQSWEAGYRVLYKVHGFGGTGFYGKEILQDLLLWREESGRKPLADEGTWTPVGPGARRGLNRLLSRRLEHDQPEREFITEVVALRAAVQPLWRRAFPKAGDLTAHDVQFCLCEVDKYLRVRKGEGRPRSTYRPPLAA